MSSLFDEPGQFDGVPPPPPPAGRQIRLAPASSIKLRRPNWVWDTAPSDSAPKDAEGRIPTGSLTIAAGLAGIGKSQFAIWLCSALTRGALPGCYYGKPRSVIVAASEDSWEMTIGPRLVAAGADMDKVFRVEVEESGSSYARLTLPVDTDELGKLIIRHDVVLVVADPLLSVLDSEVNDYRGKEVRAALDPLVDTADRTRCAILGLAHFNKSAAGGDPLLAIQGAAAFGQLIRAAIGFARDDSGEDETFVLSTTKNNLGRDNLPSLHYRITPTPVETDDGTAWVSRFEFTGHVSDRGVRDIMRDAQSGGQFDDPGQRNEAEQFIIEYLGQQGGSAAAKEVIAVGARAGFKEPTLIKARYRAKKPKIRSKRRGFGKDSEFTWSIDPGVDSEDSHIRPQESMESNVGSGPPQPHANSADFFAHTQDTSDFQAVSEPLTQNRFDSRDSSIATQEPKESKLESKAQAQHEPLQFARADCPVCGQPTALALTSTSAGVACRRCAPGIKRNTRCVDCGHPRDLLSDNRCNACHALANRHGGDAA